MGLEPDCFLREDILGGCYCGWGRVISHLRVSSLAEFGLAAHFYANIVVMSPHHNTPVWSEPWSCGSLIGSPAGTILIAESTLVVSSCPFVA